MRCRDGSVQLGSGLLSAHALGFQAGSILLLPTLRCHSWSEEKKSRLQGKSPVWITAWCHHLWGLPHLLPTSQGLLILAVIPLGIARARPRLIKAEFATSPPELGMCLQHSCYQQKKNEQFSSKPRGWWGQGRLQEVQAESGCGDSDLSSCQRLLSKPLNVSFWPPDTRFAGQSQLKIAANLELLRGLLPPDSSPIFGGRAVTIGDVTCGERKTSVKYQDTGGEIPAMRAESPFPPSTKELNPVSHTAECCCSVCGSFHIQHILYFKSISITIKRITCYKGCKTHRQ